LGVRPAVGAGMANRRGDRQQVLANAKRMREETLQVLDLARRYDGRLTVTLVASHLSVDFPEAERMLDRLVDGRRVDMLVDNDGRITYVFPELSALPPVR
jgi:hypothetical protein